MDWCFKELRGKTCDWRRDLRDGAELTDEFDFLRPPVRFEGLASSPPSPPGTGASEQTSLWGTAEMVAPDADGEAAKGNPSLTLCGRGSHLKQTHSSLLPGACLSGGHRQVVW